MFDFLIVNRPLQARPMLDSPLHPGFLCLGLSGRGILIRTSKLEAGGALPRDEKEQEMDETGERKGRTRRPTQTKRMMSEEEKAKS